jgi:hypothetical protein
LGGDEERQIRAIRDYLMVLGRPEAGKNLQVAQRLDGTAAH